MRPSAMRARFVASAAILVVALAGCIDNGAPREDEPIGGREPADCPGGRTFDAPEGGACPVAPLTQAGATPPT